jgi:hypothetical protein
MPTLLCKCLFLPGLAFPRALQSAVSGHMAGIAIHVALNQTPSHVPFAGLDTRPVTPKTWQTLLTPRSPALTLWVLFVYSLGSLICFLLHMSPPPALTGTGCHLDRSFLACLPVLLIQPHPITPHVPHREAWGLGSALSLIHVLCHILDLGIGTRPPSYLPTAFAPGHTFQPGCGTDLPLSCPELGFEFRALHLVGKHSYHLSQASSPFCSN